MAKMYERLEKYGFGHQAFGLLFLSSTCSMI
jgi:hypothetical protein